MPVTLKITSTKPTTSQFFGEVSEENNQIVKAFNDEIRALPGCLSNTMEIVDENTRIFTIVFDTEENYAHYYELRYTLAGWEARHTHNLANGIIAEAEEIIS